MTARPKAPRRGGPPVYTPETAERRASGEVKLRLSPETATRLRQLGAQHPGGQSGWVAEQIGGATPPLLSPEGAAALRKIARDTGLSAPEVLASLLGVDPLLWSLLLTAARETGQAPGELIGPLLRDAVLAAARASAARGLPS